MERFRVVAFETVFLIWDDQVQPRGGGVAFIPLESTNWLGVIAAIVKEHFHHSTVRSAEVGISTLDDAVLARFCHQYRDVYWQGGDEP